MFVSSKPVKRDKGNRADNDRPAQENRTAVLCVRSPPDICRNAASHARASHPITTFVRRTVWPCGLLAVALLQTATASQRFARRTGLRGIAQLMTSEHRGQNGSECPQRTKRVP